MGKARTGADLAGAPVDHLFLNLAEQVKMPFVQIAYAAELLTGAQNDIAESERLRRTIALSSQNALRLIDGYLLSVSLQQASQLDLEPVSISSILYDSAQDLQAYANALGCELRLNLGGKYQPVMTHRAALRSALVALGYSFIEAATNHEADQKPVVSLGLRRNAAGISAGVYSNNTSLTPALLQSARKLHGQVHQPLMNFDSTNASGVFIADALLGYLQTPLKVAKQGGLHGLAATLMPSGQLSLV